MELSKEAASIALELAEDVEAQTSPREALAMIATAGMSGRSRAASQNASVGLEMHTWLGSRPVYR